MPQNRHFDLNLLRVFIAVCQLKSFTKAAAALDLTQSSVSNAINRLKIQLGEELFIRVGRGIQPTSYALQLLIQLESSMLNIDAVLQSSAQFDPQHSQRTFYVYSLDAIIHMLQPKVDALLKDAQVNIVFREFSGDVTSASEDIRNEKVDLLLDICQLNENALTCEKVNQEHLSCIASVAHPRIQGEISRSAFFLEKHAFLNLRRFNLALVDFITTEILPPRQMYSEHASIMSMLTTIAGSDAIGTAPTSYVRRYQSLLGLQILPLPLATKPIDVFMVSATKLNDNSANRWLRDTLRQLF